MLKTVEYLQNNSLQSLIDTFKLSASRHKTYNNLVLLKYDIDSDMKEQICQECRGIILDENNNYQPVNVPYFKFWNAHEVLAATINWDTARVMEKLDGSCICLWHYDNQWHVSTTGTADAVCNAHVDATTFKDLFWKVWNKLNYSLPTDTNCCYMFELLTPLNRIIVVNEHSDIVLHGVRNRQTLQEYNPEDFAQKYNWHCVKTFNLQTIDQVIEAAKALNPIQSEGFVVCDNNFNRLKVKSPQYVALHHCKFYFSVRNILNLIRNGEINELLSYFPELIEMYNQVKEKYEQFQRDIVDVYNKYKHIEVQKDFALAIKNERLKPFLFLLRKGCSIVEHLKIMEDWRLEGWLGVDEELTKKILIESIKK